MTDLIVSHCGLEAYPLTLEKMRTFTRERQADTTDELWLVEHSPVFTQGRAGKAEHLKHAGTIPLVQSDRGGQITYHGPGQLVAYPLLDLKRLRMNVRDLVACLEQTTVALLKDYDVEAKARPDAPGVYVGESKIASLGLRISRHCCFHGIAINIDMDLGPFEQINPCGFAGMKMTQLKACIANGTVPTLADVADAFATGLAKSLGARRLQPSPTN